MRDFEELKELTKHHKQRFGRIVKCEMYKLEEGKILALTGRPGGAADEARPRRPEDALLEECAELLEVEPLPVTADAEEAAAWRADVRKRAAARSG